MCVSGFALSALAEPEDTPVENSGETSALVTDGTESSSPENGETDVTSHTVTVSASNGGIVTAGTVAGMAGGSNTVSVNSGENLVLSFFPSPDFALESVTVNGTAVEVSGNSYTLSGVSADTQVAVNFKSTLIVENNLTLGAT